MDVHCTIIRSKALDQLLPRPDRARISGPKGPEILVCNMATATFGENLGLGVSLTQS